MPMQMCFPIMWWKISIFPNFALNSKQLTQAILYSWPLTFPCLLYKFVPCIFKNEDIFVISVFHHFSCPRLKPFHFYRLFQIHALNSCLILLNARVWTFQILDFKISLGIGLAISFPLTSKPFTIMHKSSIMDFKKCFKEKEIVVYSRKNKAQTCKMG